MLKHISILINSGKLENCPKILLVGGSSGDKESAYNEEDPGLIPGSGRSPGEGNDNAFQYPCLGKSHGQRNLLGYIPWGLKTRTRLATKQ